MFSTYAFYEIIHKQLICKVSDQAYCFSFNNFESTNPSDIQLAVDVSYLSEEKRTEKYRPIVFFHDQEPFYPEVFDNIFKFDSNASHYIFADSFNVDVPGENGVTLNTWLHDINYFRHHFLVFANSEKSVEIDKNLQSRSFYNWYYFSHGFIALDWYRNTKYLPANYKFDKTFITFNNMVSGNRNYRLTLLAKLLEKRLDSFGLISMNKNDLDSKIKKEIFDQTNFLSAESRKLIFKNLFQKKVNFQIDTSDIKGELSAFSELKTLSAGFLHLVTETIFYEEKLHLTEKIFKPIIARRPFLLVAGQGNLAYLKSYGFKTFNKWIDESYDNECDPDKRINMIVDQLEKICKLSHADLIKMQTEMLEITEYNFNHFFTNFKNIIVNELVDNFRLLVIKYNAGKDSSFPFYLNHTNVDYDAIKDLLKS